MKPLARLARVTHRRRWPVLIAFVVLLAAGAIYGAGAPQALVLSSFQAPDSESARTSKVLARTFSMGEPDVVVAYEHAVARVGSSRFQRLLRPALERLQALAEVKNVSSPYEPGSGALISADGRIALVPLELAEGRTEEAQVAAFHRLEPHLKIEGLKATIGGTVPAMVQTQRGAERDLARAELITLPLVALLLVLFFRSPILPLLPLLIGGFATVAALCCLRLLAYITDVSIFSLNIVTFLGLGVAIDYSLFMSSRVRDELRAGHDVATALERTMSTAGRTIAFSGVAVAVSLLGTLVFPLVLMRSVAIGGTIVVCMSLVATLVFLPAGLAALGKRIEWASFGRRGLTTGGLWRRIANLVMRAPVVVMCVTTVLLLLLGAPFLRVEGTFGGINALPPKSGAREVREIVRSKRFPTSALMPIEIVVDTDAPVLSRAGLTAVERYADAVSALPGIARVEAIVGGKPGRPAARLLPLIERGATAARAPRAIRRSVRGDRTVVHAFASATPESEASQRLVKTIRTLSVPGVARTLVGGDAARIVDLKALINRRLPWAISLICLTTLVALFLAFGSIAIPLKAIVMNGLSLTASFGALVWIFQDGRFEGLLGYRSTGTIELTVPVIIFAVVFGLAMDYELFLLSRIREAYDDRHDTKSSVALGLEQSGRIISRAAILLIAVMIGFISASMVLVKQIGVSMAVAVAVDVTIVRALLVPATMQVLGRYNWWAPRWLQRLSDRLGLGIRERGPAS